MGDPAERTKTPSRCHLAHVLVRTLGFAYTARCNYGCDHCSAECGPQKQEKLDSHMVMKRIDEAAALGVNGIAFTGGECMLYVDEILPLMERARDNGQAVAINTNGFWGSTRDKAASVVSRLKAAGLKMLELSYDELHAKAGARIEHVDNILAACRRSGVSARILRVQPSVWSDESWIIDGELRIRDLSYEVSSLAPYGTALTCMPMDRKYYRRARTDRVLRCDGVGRLLYAPNGSLLPCCGQGIFDCMKGRITGHLVLGHIGESLAECLNRSADNLFLLILAVLGPRGIVLLNEEYGDYVTLPHEVYNPCDICVTSSRDERFHDFLAELGKDGDAIVSRLYRCHDVIARWGLTRCELVGREG